MNTIAKEQCSWIVSFVTSPFPQNPSVLSQGDFVSVYCIIERKASDRKPFALDSKRVIMIVGAEYRAHYTVS